MVTKKVLICATWIKLGGGVTRALIEMLKRMPPENYNVTLLLFSLDKDVRHVIPSYVHVIVNADSPTNMSLAERIIGSLNNPLKFAAFCLDALAFKLDKDLNDHYRRLSRWDRRINEKFDIAIAYGMLDSYCNRFTLDNVKAAKKIMWCHIDPGLYKGIGIKGMGKTYCGYDGIKCVSRECIERMAIVYPELSKKMSVAYNFMDTERIQRLAQECPIDVGFGKINLCTVARITQEKGILDIVDIATRMRDVGVDFCWWVVGPVWQNEYYERVIDKINENNLAEYVLLLGQRENPYMYMNACDIYVQPSKFEGFCTTTNEARLLCKPVVVTAVSGVNEQFTDRIDGSIVPIDKKYIYDEIMRLIFDETIRKQYRDRLEQRREIRQSIEEMLA